MRLVTLNVWGLPDWIGGDGELRKQAIGEHLGRLAPDVLAVQEIWTDRWRDALLAGANAAGLVHAWHNPDTFGGSGLVVCSRFPIREASFTQFSVCGHADRIDHGDYYSGKGFAVLQFEGDAGAWALFDTHLVAQYTADADDRYRGQRVGQLVELARAIAATSLPVVAMGDFNIAAPGELYDLWKGLSGVRDVAAELDRREPTILADNPYRGDGAVDKRIDYVFVRDGVGAGWHIDSIERVFDERLDFGGVPGAYSDHAGLLVQLELKEGGAPLPGPDRRAMIDAAEWLATGRAAARQRRRGQRTLAGGSLALACAATAAALSPPVSRRRLLRAAAVGAVVAGAVGVVGFGSLSEHFAPEELEGLARAEAALRALRESVSPEAAPLVDS